MTDDQEELAFIRALLGKKPDATEADPPDIAEPTDLTSLARSIFGTPTKEN